MMKLVTNSSHVISKIFLNRESVKPILCIIVLIRIMWTVGRLVDRALDSGLEGPGSTPVPPNTLRVQTEYVLVKSVDPKFLRAESRVQRTGENFPPFQSHA
ncbi:hypothetical protein TNCV_895491 [Trichonephila clavipes]|nr:hypothetical protein TNCV_895491 [Trichonephila clavipes]